MPLPDSRERAAELNEAGRLLHAEGRDLEAIAAYREAAAADPSWSVPWYNLALVHKYRGEWEASAAANRGAVRRDSSDVDAWWNLGIAATALGRWIDAREAWTRCGVAVPEGQGPVVGDFGLTPIRLNPQGRGEVVWCDRIDPARAVIRNVPLPESEHRWGDVMLHDGAPNGTRMLHGREVSVFDALARLERSPCRTWVLDVRGGIPEAVERLPDVADELGGAAEVWSRSVSFLCRKCSEGRPHREHDRELRGDRPELPVGLAARDEHHVTEIVEAWARLTGFGGRVTWAAADEDDAT